MINRGANGASLAMMHSALRSRGEESGKSRRKGGEGGSPCKPGAARQVPRWRRIVEPPGGGQLLSDAIVNGALPRWAKSARMR